MCPVLIRIICSGKEGRSQLRSCWRRNHPEPRLGDPHFLLLREELPLSVCLSARPFSNLLDLLRRNWLSCRVGFMTAVALIPPPLPPNTKQEEKEQPTTTTTYSCHKERPHRPGRTRKSCSSFSLKTWIIRSSRWLLSTLFREEKNRSFQQFLRQNSLVSPPPSLGPGGPSLPLLVSQRLILRHRP